MNVQHKTHSVYCFLSELRGSLHYPGDLIQKRDCYTRRSDVYNSLFRSVFVTYYSIRNFSTRAYILVP